MKYIIFSFIGLSLLGINAEASRNERRERRQEARINQGVQSGQLTEAEQRRLQRGQGKVDAAQERAAADGTVTPQEKRRLERMQNRQSRRIWKQKHDRQTQPGSGTEPADPGQAPAQPADPAQLPPVTDEAAPASN